MIQDADARQILNSKSQTNFIQKGVGDRQLTDFLSQGDLSHSPCVSSRKSSSPNNPLLPLPALNFGSPAKVFMHLFTYVFSNEAVNLRATLFNSKNSEDGSSMVTDEVQPEKKHSAIPPSA